MTLAIPDRPFRLFRCALRADDLLLAGLLAEALPGARERLEAELRLVGPRAGGRRVSLLALRVIARVRRRLRQADGRD